MQEKHCFVVCAYKESPYIEECIESLVQQTIPSRIIVATSTPGEYLQKLCEKYQIAYCIREGKPNISLDWEFALSVADTEYVTIAHQDDVYEPEYVESVLSIIEKEEREYHRQPLILFSDYKELIGNERMENRTNLKIKRVLLAPLKNPRRQERVFWKRWVIRYGNAICCPSVTYHMPAIRKYMQQDGREQLFQKHFRSNVDWETWEWLSRKEGSFVYLTKQLMAHRIHGESETTATIQNRQRGREDYEMFCKFWPKWIARCLSGAYGESEKGNVVS